MDQGREPTPSPNALLTELGLDAGGLETDTLLSQRELMMRSLLDGSIPVAQRTQIQKDYYISDQDLQDFADSGPSTAATTRRPTTGGKRPRRRPLPASPAGSRRRGSGGGGGGPPGGGSGGGGGPPGGGGGGGGGGSPGGGGGGGSPGGSSRCGGRRRRLDQDGLRRQMDLLSQDAHQRTYGCHIRNITHTNTMTTVYEDGGTPTVRRTSSRLSNP